VTAESDLMEARVALDEAIDVLQAMVQFLPHGPDLWAQDKTAKQLGISYRRLLRRPTKAHGPAAPGGRENAENDDKGAEVSVMLFCLCVVPCKTIYMCLYVSMNLSMNLSICVSVCLPTFHSIIEGQALGG